MDPRTDIAPGRPRASRAVAWVLLAAVLVSPFFLLAAGALPPWAPWRLVFALVLVGVLVQQCVRARTAWPLVALIVWPAFWLQAMHYHFPCWRYSEAEWCGRACQQDPCSCPVPSDARRYGDGAGCPQFPAPRAGGPRAAR